jgi:hypothetical protein
MQAEEGKGEMLSGVQIQVSGEAAAIFIVSARPLTQFLQARLCRETTRA